MLERILKLSSQQFPPILVTMPGRIPPPKRRPKRVVVSRLFPQPKTELCIHAMALLGCIQKYSPDVIGTYVPVADLVRVYRDDVCGRHGWTPRKWCGIGRQLGRLTRDKKPINRDGQRHTAYLIPAP